MFMHVHNELKTVKQYTNFRKGSVEADSRLRASFCATVLKDTFSKNDLETNLEQSHSSVTSVFAP